MRASTGAILGVLSLAAPQQGQALSMLADFSADLPNGRS
jgi:hypothetical protein